MKLRLLLCSFFLLPLARAQEVEVVIAAGLDWAQCVAISNDHRFVAKSILNTCSIWDVKTGRMIRNIPYTQDLMMVSDSIWFSDDNSKLVIALMMTNDRFEVDVETGKTEKITGPPMDWANYKYAQSNQLQSTTHLYSTSMKDLSFPSPDKKKEVIYHKVKSPYGSNNVMPYIYQVLVKANGTTSPVLDSAFAASFVFSHDSKYLFANNAIYDLEANRMISDLKIVPFSGRSVMFKADTHIPVTAGINSIRHWDFPDVKDLPVTGIANFRAANNRTFLICEQFNLADASKQFSTVDLSTGIVKPLPVKTDESGYLLDISADGKFFCYLEMTKATQTAEVKFNIKIHDTETGRLVKTVKNATKAYFTADNNVMITDSLGMQTFRHTVSSGKSARFPTDGVTDATTITGISDDHAYVLGYAIELTAEQTYNCKVNAWDSKTGENVFEAVVPGIMISAAQVSPDHKYIAFASSIDNAIFIYEMATGTKIHELHGHLSMIEITCFSDDSKRLISSSLDGTRRVWNLEKGTQMVSLITTGEKDYAIVTPTQYYYATKGAQRLVHFVKGSEIFPFEQFDLKYNRPDIIIESLEATNQSLVEPFNLAYQKRLARLGFTEEMLDGDFHLPVISLVNEKDIPFSTSAPLLTLDIAAEDDRFKLDRVMIRVNDVPVNGISGINLREANTHEFKKQVQVQLSNGKNHIAVTVLNEKGVESIAANLEIDYLAEDAKKPDFYLFTIGVSEYRQSNYNLSFAAKDAEDMKMLFTSASGNFNQVITYHLTNEQVTLQSLRDLKAVLAKTNVDDAVCIFYAGHGVLDKNLDYFLASYDMDFNNPADKGIPYETLEKLLGDIPARKKLLLLDACHSGEIDKEEVVLVENNNVESSGDLTFRAITNTTVQQVGLTNSFELMKELFTDVKKSWGTMIISSAGGMEYAIEGSEWNNGVFTYCMLNGISAGKADLDHNGKIMLSEINAYVREQVYTLTDGRQQPTTRAEVTGSDWRLW